MKYLLYALLTCLLFVNTSSAAIKKKALVDLKAISKSLQAERLQKNQRARKQLKPAMYSPKKKIQKSKVGYKGAFFPVDQRPYFDIPVTYNRQVKKWIKFYQTDGRRWFKERLERSYKYLPIMQKTLENQGLPQDLAYIAMIESGFSASAVSTASAVGYWQFIRSTANRYGLKTNWWIDERKDFMKSTSAAAKYLGDLFKMFDSWYLTAAAYNMGEGRTSRLIKKYKTNNFWELSYKPDFPAETKNYIPKLIAALLIAKAPKLYGFHNITPMSPLKYEYFNVPGGTDLHNMSRHLGVRKTTLKKLNPELLLGFVPGFVLNHKIRIPHGYTGRVSRYIRTQL